MTKTRRDQRKTTETTMKQVIKRALNIYLSIITLNANGVSTSIKKDWALE